MTKESKKRPELRFPEFTDDWEQHKLGDISEIKTGPFGSMLHADDYVSDGVPIITTEHFKTGTLPTDKCGLPQVSENDFNRLLAYILNEGDIVFSRVGSVDINALITPFQSNWLFSGRVLRVRPQDKNSSQFLHTLLETENIKSDIRARAVGQAMPSINTEILKTTQLLLPVSIAEQELLGEYFHNLDNLIALHQRELDELKELKKCMLQKMFPKKGEKIPEIRFPEFTGDWEQHKFEDVVTIGSGKDYKHLESGNVPVYGTGGYMLSVNQALSENEDAVGIGRKGTIDKPYILRAPFWTVDTLFYCIPNKGFDLTFTNCLFQNVDWKKKDESTGVPSLSKVIINNVKTYVPSLSEQQRIGEYFSNLDNLITLQQKEIDGYKELKKGLLQQMFC